MLQFCFLSAWRAILTPCSVTACDTSVPQQALPALVAAAVAGPHTPKNVPSGHCLCWQQAGLAVDRIEALEFFFFFVPSSVQIPVS